LSALLDVGIAISLFGSFGFFCCVVQSVVVTEVSLSVASQCLLHFDQQLQFSCKICFQFPTKQPSTFDSLAMTDNNWIAPTDLKHVQFFLCGMHGSRTRQQNNNTVFPAKTK